MSDTSAVAIILAAAAAIVVSAILVTVRWLKPMPPPAVEHRIESVDRIAESFHAVTPLQPHPVQTVRIEPPAVSPLAVDEAGAAPPVVGVAPVPRAAFKPPQGLVMDICRRHNGYKQTTHNGRGWRCVFPRS